MELTIQRWSDAEFFREREKVLALWPTGRQVDLEEAGHWMITVVSTVNQQERSVEFTQEVSKSGPNWVVLSGFFGAMLAIIVVAAITRKKRVKVAAEGS